MECKLTTIIPTIIFIKMKKIITLLIIATLISCETEVVKVPLKAGEIALGPNTGSKYYLTSDDNVDIVKKLLESWNNMDPDGMFEVLEDTITWYDASEKKPIVADKNFIIEYMSAYDSISQVVQGYIPHQYEGQTADVVSVASRETKFKKDGTVEDDRLFERFFIRNGKIFRVMAWSAVWNTN